MGRYLALGIATTIYVEKNKNSLYSSKNFNLNKNKNKIINEMNKFLDMSKYHCVENVDSLYFRMGRKHFNDNIYALLKELKPIINCDRMFFGEFFGYNKEMTIEEVIKQKYKIKLDIYDETYHFDNEHQKENLLNEFYIECNGETTNERYSPFEAPACWLFDGELSDRVRVSFGYMLIWCDWNKYVGEDETPMLKLLNTFSRNYFHNPLSKNILFYIDG